MYKRQVPVVCDTTRLQLGSTTTQAVAVPLYSLRHWYNVRRIVGGDRDLNAPCWLRRYVACFLFINSGVSHGLNGGALPNAPTSTVPPQRTSVEVTDSLLCPPELELVARVSRPLFVCVRGVLAPRRLASPQSLSCAIQHVYSLDSLRRRRLLLLSIL